MAWDSKVKQKDGSVVSRKVNKKGTKIKRTQKADGRTVTQRKRVGPGGRKTKVTKTTGSKGTEGTAYKTVQKSGAGKGRTTTRTNLAAKKGKAPRKISSQTTTTGRGSKTTTKKLRGPKRAVKNLIKKRKAGKTADPITKRGIKREVAVEGVNNSRARRKTLTGKIKAAKGNKNKVAKLKARRANVNKRTATRTKRAVRLTRKMKAAKRAKR